MHGCLLAFRLFAVQGYVNKRFVTFKHLVMILTDKEKMVLTPTYYVLKMYVPFQDATFVPVTLNAGA